MDWTRHHSHTIVPSRPRPEAGPERTAGRS